MTAAPAALDPRALRNALGCFPTGVTVMTTLRGDGAPVGLTVNSFASVSLDPPLILWSLVQHSPSLPAFRAAHRFCVNVLTADQEALCRRFASPLPDKFAEVPWHAGLDGVPVIEGCLATFECSSAFNNWGGDHVIFVGRVERFETRDAPALLFHRGRLCAAPSA
jgi:3-hydroxy-9,10-secoandrosta-1,3,5(10)-triene-9,17-dione monooxygenase reductase component